MCYSLKDVAYRNLQIALRYSYPEERLDELKDLYEELRKTVPAMHYVNGFEHPELIGLITENSRLKVSKMQWGLIPRWAKDPVTAAKISNQTLNARGETLFEKPSFRNAARHHRCIIPVDGFYEYHDKNGLKIPYHIKMKNSNKMLLAGLWEDWQSPDGNMERRTFSIVTTKGSPMLSEIHNKPSGSQGPRMPVILHPEMAEKWLLPDNQSADAEPSDLEDLILPYDDNELLAYTVRKLAGKDGIGNDPRASEPFEYNGDQ